MNKKVDFKNKESIYQFIKKVANDSFDRSNVEAKTEGHCVMSEKSRNDYLLGYIASWFAQIVQDELTDKQQAYFAKRG